MVENNIHLNLQHGGTKINGPSAGSAIVTAILSLALNKSVNDVAITGKIALTGKILRVGGIKDKFMAAKRAKAMMTIILPEANRKDFDDLPEMTKKGMTVKFAETYQEVFNYAFPSD